MLANGMRHSHTGEGADPPRYTDPRGVVMDGYQVQAVIYREDKHYVAQCLNVDVSSFGETEEEAVANLREALELYFEDMPETVITPVEAPEVRQLTVQHA
jgi:predicted RNase H-like HicB family nuclease